MNFRVRMFVKSAVNNLAINIRWNEVPDFSICLIAGGYRSGVLYEMVLSISTFF